MMRKLRAGNRMETFAGHVAPKVAGSDVLFEVPFLGSSNASTALLLREFAPRLLSVRFQNLSESRLFTDNRSLPIKNVNRRHDSDGQDGQEQCRPLEVKRPAHVLVHCKRQLMSKGDKYELNRYSTYWVSNTWQRCRQESLWRNRSRQWPRPRRDHRRQPCSRLLPCKLQTVEGAHQMLPAVRPRLTEYLDLHWQCQSEMRISLEQSSAHEVDRDWSKRIQRDRSVRGAQLQSQNCQTLGRATNCTLKGTYSREATRVLLRAEARPDPSSECVAGSGSSGRTKNML